MQLPQLVKEVLERIEESGYEAYVVGGCVRDALLGSQPSDWDICTSALPERLLDLFADVPCIPTGLKHGTVTVVWKGESMEITTYRTEKGYSDGRHPDRVHFVTSIHDDLSRRDFTVNAMAYHPARGLIDPFGGKADLDRGLLRCVGVAETRFREDALRILRGMRFAACYGFSVEAKTAAAILNEADGLHQVAAERIRAELERLLIGKGVGGVLRQFREVLFRVIPELKAADGFEQHSPYHHLDVFAHTVEAVSQAAPELPVRLALLLHDAGKPECFTWDELGHGHFYGHAAVSEQMARDILHRLRYDRMTIERVLLLIRYHDTLLYPEEPRIKRWLNRFGEDFFRQLLLVKEGDCLGQIPSLKGERLPELEQIKEVLDRVVAQQQCFSLKDLAINGRDVLALGIAEGKQVGAALEWALNAVMDGSLPNEQETLLAALRKKT